MKMLHPNQVHCFPLLVHKPESPGGRSNKFPKIFQECFVEVIVDQGELWIVLTVYWELELSVRNIPWHKQFAKIGAAIQTFG